MILGTSTGCYKFPFEDDFRIFGCMMNRQGKTCDTVEERMQSANKALCKDIKIYESKDVPWRIECQRLVDHVYAVFSLRKRNLVVDTADIGKMKGWENNDRKVCGAP